MPGFSFSLFRRRGSEDEAWAEGTRCEMKTKIQCGSKEKQEGIDQKSMKKNMKMTNGCVKTSLHTNFYA